MKKNKSLVKQVKRLLNNPPGQVKLEKIYRLCIGKKQGQLIWIVDGARVHQLLYPYFVAGGNDQRYRYNPEKDIWIDNRMGVLELPYTVFHELLERKLMKERGWTYDQAHDTAIAEEEKLRLAAEKRCARKDASCATLWKRHWRKSALKLGSQKCHNIYRAFYGTVKGMNVWLVDGTEVRRMLDGDYLYAAHDLDCKYIPAGEIWLDVHQSCEEAWYSLVGVICERSLRALGKSASRGGRRGLAAQWQERQQQAVRAHTHELSLPPVQYGCRERGGEI